MGAEKKLLKICENPLCDNPTNYKLCFVHYNYKLNRARARNAWQRRAEFWKSVNGEIK